MERASAWSRPGTTRVRIFGLEGARLLREFGGSGRPLWDARFVDGDRQLLTLAWSGESEYEAHTWDLAAQHPIPRFLGRHSAWGRMEIVPSADGSRFALSRTSDEPLIVLDARTGAELLALRGHLGLNFGILGFLGAGGERLVTYDDHGLLVTFDASRGHALAAELDVLPRAREVYEEMLRDELYLERVVDRLRDDLDMPLPLRTAALELALEAGRDRASFIKELELALLRPQRDQEALASSIERAERLASFDPAEPDEMRILALASCRRSAWAAARDQALAARALLAANDPTLEGVLALSELALGNASSAGAHRDELARLLHENAYAASGGEQVFLAEVDAALAREVPAPGKTRAE